MFKHKKETKSVRLGCNCGYAERGKGNENDNICQSCVETGLERYEKIQVRTVGNMG